MKCLENVLKISFVVLSLTLVLASCSEPDLDVSNSINELVDIKEMEDGKTFVIELDAEGLDKVKSTPEFMNSNYTADVLGVGQYFGDVIISKSISGKDTNQKNAEERMGLIAVGLNGQPAIYRYRLLDPIDNLNHLETFYNNSNEAINGYVFGAWRYVHWNGIIWKDVYRKSKTCNDNIRVSISLIRNNSSVSYFSKMRCF